MLPAADFGFWDRRWLTGTLRHYLKRGFLCSLEDWISCRSSRLFYVRYLAKIFTALLDVQCENILWEQNERWKPVRKCPKRCALQLSNNVMSYPQNKHVVKSKTEQKYHLRQSCWQKSTSQFVVVDLRQARCFVWLNDELEQSNGHLGSDHEPSSVGVQFKTTKRTRLQSRRHGGLWWAYPPQTKY